MSKLNIKSMMMIVVVLVIVTMAAIFLFNPTVKLPKPVHIDTTNQPTLGNQNAKVHIVAFEDLKCHNCMRFNVEILPKIKKAYVDTGKAKYTVMNVAFLPGSMPAANAARCLYQQNKKFFFPYVKTLYNHQGAENQNWATIPKLVSFASQLPGVNKKKLSQCIYKSPYTPLLNKNLKQGMRIMGGAVATPTVYVNGYVVKPLTFDRIKKVIKAVQ